MSDPLYLIELRPDPAALLRFAEDQGINSRRDEDLGYVTHAWLAATFGAGAPKPFRLLQDRRNSGPPRLLGISRRSGEELAEHACAFASPLALRVCPFGDGVPAKPMPDRWRPGRRLGFELLACPISRLGKNEDDVYRRHRREREESGQEPETRAEVYRRWLARQLGDACSLEDYSLDGFRNMRLLRRAADGRRDFLAPQALFAGILQVKNNEAFNTLLARGVGRHRAFGCGMLLLRPAP
jgi:CRISPR system Cascade subunit CasE